MIYEANDEESLLMLMIIWEADLSLKFLQHEILIKLTFDLHYELANNSLDSIELVSLVLD